MTFSHYFFTLSHYCFIEVNGLCGKMMRFRDVDRKFAIRDGNQLQINQKIIIKRILVEIIREMKYVENYIEVI